MQILNFTKSNVFPGALLALSAALVTMGTAQGAGAAKQELAHRDTTTRDSLPTEFERQQSEVSRLIDQLGSDQYVERRRAEQQLLRLGAEAFDLLRAATEHEDLEIATRARYLMQQIKVNWAATDDDPRVKLLLKDYEVASDAQRRGIMERLARLPDDVGLAALCRIARFEMSDQLSKNAALLVINANASSEDMLGRREQVINRCLQQSARPAAHWLRNYILSYHDAAAARDKWDGLVREEKRLPAEAEDLTDDLVASMLYAIAGLEDRLGNDTAAAGFVDQALKIAATDPLHHRRQAYQLRDRSHIAWAEQEFRRGIAAAGSDNEIAIQVASELAEMLHDQLKDLEAANVLKEKLEDINFATSQSFREERAQMEFFFAEHYAAQGDRDKQREHLQRAVQADPTHADVLIAMYRVPDADEAYKAKTRQLIDEAAAEFQQQIGGNTDPAFYNQWAWLIGNTEGDYDKAVKYAHVAVEAIRKAEDDPDTPIPSHLLWRLEGGYLDTLGRCCFAQGDLQNAVRYQQLAADMLPSSKLVARQLDEFKAALAKAKRQSP